MFGFFVLMVLWYLYPSGISYLFNICMLHSCVVYVGLLYAYCICKVRYVQMPREFVNPFGLTGALYGMALFGFMLIALSFFQRDHYVALAVVLGSIALMTWYYFVVVQTRELFSLEEQEKFMQAYILNGTPLFLHIHLYTSESGNINIFLCLLFLF